MFREFQAGERNFEISKSVFVIEVSIRGYREFRKAIASMIDSMISRGVM